MLKDEIKKIGEQHPNRTDNLQETSEYEDWNLTRYQLRQPPTYNKSGRYYFLYATMIII